MKVFVIPTWHPTPTRPLWCNWVVPHIDMLRESGIQAYVLQLGLDGEEIPYGTDPWRQPIRLRNNEHLYVPVPNTSKSYQRTRFFYGAFLRKYATRIRELYKVAVEKWGKPDILHAHVSLPAGYLAAGLGQEFGVPVIVQEHYSGFESDARFPWRTGCFVKQMGRRIQGFYGVSQGYASRIERTGLMHINGVLPNPVDTVMFEQKNLKRRESFQIVTTGTVGKIKGTDILFEALRLLPEDLHWSVILFGDLANSNRFRRWLDAPGFSHRVSLPGKVSQSELVDFYSQSDLFVVSSRSDTANVSMLEAMACGLPVVTTRCGGPETLIDDTVGVSITPNDPRALAEGILSVARNPEKFDRAASRRFVIERYSKPVVAKLVMAAYSRALNGSMTV